MRVRPSRHIVALISLLVFLLTGQAGVHGFVWCIGEDGHAALEYAANAACGSTAQGAGLDFDGKRIAEISPSDDHCGPCLDVSTSLEVTSRRTLNRDNLAAQVGASFSPHPSPVPPFAQVLTVKLYPQPPPRISQAILSHRTVVLLN